MRSTSMATFSSVSLLVAFCAPPSSALSNRSLGAKGRTSAPFTDDELSSRLSTGHAATGFSETWRKFEEGDPFLAPVRFVAEEATEKDLNENYFQIEIYLETKSLQIFRDSVLIYNVTGKMKNKEMTHGGIHMMVIHPSVGNVMAQRHFKTSQPSDSKALAKAVTRVLPGRILILVAVPLGLYFLDQTTQTLLEQVGSRRIRRVAYNETWVLICHKEQGDSVAEVSKERPRSKVWLEEVTLSAYDRRGVPPSRISLNIPKFTQNRCNWEELPEKRIVKEFCDVYDGYPEICRCDNPIDAQKIRLSAPKVVVREVIPVALLTAINAWNFYRQVLNIVSLPGASQTPIFVFIDGYNKEINAIASLFKLPVYVHRPQGWNGSYTRLNMHFRFSVYNIFNLNTEAKKAIILEDDLLLSPDFFLYFQQTAWLLDADPTIYCINAFSVNSYVSVASDSSKLRRSNAFPQFGWMVTREWAHTQLPLWVPEQVEKADWDWWLSMSNVKKGRDVIVPEISRTFHAGAAGAHVTGWEQAFFYSAMTYNQHPNAKLSNISRMVKTIYDQDLEVELKTAKVLASDFDPCNSSSFPPQNDDDPGTSYKFFVKANSKLYEDLNGFILIALCFHGHSRDFRDMYKGILQFNIKNRRLFVIGCPLSPYCKKLKGSSMVMEPSEDALQEAENRDLSWRSKDYFLSYSVRWKPTNIKSDYDMTNLFQINKSFTGL